MARLRTPESGRVYLGAMDVDDYDPRARERNGEYRGPLTVREIAPGVSGESLDTRPLPARGEVWKRGTALVRVLGVERNGRWVRFQELTHGKSLRRTTLRQFMSRATRQGDS